MTAAADRLDRILARLPAEDAQWLARQIEAPWQRRARKLAERDETIRAARRFFPNERVTVSAEALAKALGDYLAGKWLRDRSLEELAPGATAQHAALHRIAKLNSGEPLGWRQIANIFSGTRGR